MKRSISAGLLLALVSLSLAASNSIAVAQPAPPPVDYQAEVVATMPNSVGDPVLYRRGWWYAETPNKGFGFDKVFHKHNITNDDVVRYVVGGPIKVENAGNGRWIHWGSFDRRDCGLTGCTVLETVGVKVVIDYSNWGLAPERGMLGINTAYCEGYVRCPDWVNATAPAVPTARGGEGEPDVVYNGRG